MDPFYAFLLFAVIVILELLAAQTWFGLYYRIGIPVSFHSVSLSREVDLAGTTQALEQRFKNRLEHPTIRFKPLSSGAIAFREALFENRAGFKYFPVIHSIVQINDNKGRATITSFLNWYVLFALVYIVYRTSNDFSFTPVGVLLLAIFFLSYFIQVRINRAIAQELI